MSRELSLTNVTYFGPPIDDPGTHSRLPPELAKVLRQINGFIQFHGGLHVRGACRAPAWHSLADAWAGPDAFHRHYRTVRLDDVPFGQDCFGDQFLLRDGVVWKLESEHDRCKSWGVNLDEFLRHAQADPVGYLSFPASYPLEPGQLLNVLPPFVTARPDKGYSFKPIPDDERRRFLFHLARAVRDLDDGDEIRLVPT